jgi:hypothetical protein
LGRHEIAGLVEGARGDILRKNARGDPSEVEEDEGSGFLSSHMTYSVVRLAMAAIITKGPDNTGYLIQPRFHEACLKTKTRLFGFFTPKLSEMRRTSGWYVGNKLPDD